MAPNSRRRLAILILSLHFSIRGPVTRSRRLQKNQRRRPTEKRTSPVTVPGPRNESLNGQLSWGDTHPRVRDAGLGDGSRLGLEEPKVSPGRITRRVIVTSGPDRRRKRVAQRIMWSSLDAPSVPSPSGVVLMNGAPMIRALLVDDEASLATGYAFSFRRKRRCDLSALRHLAAGHFPVETVLFWLG